MEYAVTLRAPSGAEEVVRVDVLGLSMRDAASAALRLDGRRDHSVMGVRRSSCWEDPCASCAAARAELGLPASLGDDPWLWTHGRRLVAGDVTRSFRPVGGAHLTGRVTATGAIEWADGEVTAVESVLRHGFLRRMRQSEVHG